MQIVSPSTCIAGRHGMPSGYNTVSF